MSERSITEDEFEKLKELETATQEKKAAANTEAEKAKTALEEYEDQLILSIQDCLEHDIIGVGTTSRDLDELLAELKKSDAILKGKTEENIKNQSELERECRQLKKAEDELDGALNAETEEVKSAKDALQKKKSENGAAITETKATLATLDELSYDSLQKALADKEGAIAKVEEINDLLETTLKAKAEADNVLTAIEAQIATLRSNLESQQTDEKALKADLDAKLAAYGFDTAEEMRKLVVSEDELSKAERQINEYRQAVSTNETRLVQARTDAKGKKRIDVEELGTLCREQEENVALIRKAENAVANRLSNNVEKQKSIEGRRGDLERSRNDYSICRRLYDLVRGTTGNGKITLEQYIQAAGFDGIIAAANRRLQPMSDGQYELFRQEDTLGKRSNNFLDLEVFDNYTGHRRPVGNLSGGESFKASLSLALGLSDTVSTNLGGVQMDALFLDEGFGTLDRRSIDSAMDILINLSGSNKLVGVISHREELIENIPQQIRVRKTKDGSKLEIDTGV